MYPNIYIKKFGGAQLLGFPGLSKGLNRTTTPKKISTLKILDSKEFGSPQIEGVLYVGVNILFATT